MSLVNFDEQAVFVTHNHCLGSVGFVACIYFVHHRGGGGPISMANEICNFTVCTA